MRATRRVARSKVGASQVITTHANWSDFLGVEDCGQFVDGSFAVHVADSEEGDEFTEATITHAGKPLSFVELDEASVGDATAECEDKRGQSHGHFLTQAQAERLVNGQILNSTTDVGNVFRGQQQAFLLGSFQTSSSSFTTITQKGVFAGLGDPDGQDSGDVVTIQDVVGVGEDNFAFHGSEE